MTVTRTTVHADLELQAKDRFHAVPFVVPAGTESLGIRIAFDSSRGVVDLGCEGPSGWRGWSGGARREFMISADTATPGYLPGVLEAGEWSVILGLHNLPASSVDIEVEISFPSEVTAPVEAAVPPLTGIPRGSSRDLPAPPGFAWYAGDFHNHTVHSDGSQSIAALARLGVEMGLDFMAVTDHNTVSHHPHLERVGLEQGITLIPGQEVTTHQGHGNAFGDIGWIDFRRPLQEWIDETEQRGGVFSINHPIDADCSWVIPLERGPHAVEFWHSSWYRDLIGDGILSWYAAGNRDLVLLGGSDFHNHQGPQRPGRPATWVLARENTPEALLEGVKAGRTALTGISPLPGQSPWEENLSCPIALRIDENQIWVDQAAGNILTSFSGRRQVISDSPQIIEAPAQDGPYFVTAPDRTMLAITA